VLPTGICFTSCLSQEVNIMLENKRKYTRKD